jgi:hypothetical protein
VRDPKDDYLVALASAANADVLVSIDNDLEAPVDDVTTCRPEILPPASSRTALVRRACKPAPSTHPFPVPENRGVPGSSPGLAK